MPNGPHLPEPPSAEEPTEAEVARYLVARCCELEGLADHLHNPAIGRFLREAREKAQDVLAGSDLGPG